jgi:hypothetical protein
LARYNRSGIKDVDQETLESTVAFRTRKFTNERFPASQFVPNPLFLLKGARVCMAELEGCHSYRSATIGSTFAARRAGI